MSFTLLPLQSSVRVILIKHANSGGIKSLQGKIVEMKQLKMNNDKSTQYVTSIRSHVQFGEYFSFSKQLYREMPFYQRIFVLLIFVSWKFVSITLRLMLFKLILIMLNSHPPLLRIRIKLIIN